MKRISVDQGVLFHLIQKVRPELASYIQKTKEIETVIIGLGGQGTKHAGLMRDFGTNVTAGVSVGRGGTRIHEVIPVYDRVKECLKEHPNIAVASIWRHYSGVRDVVIEVIESGIPIVVLISEGIPLKDVRDIIVAARKHNTLLFGGNTPGIIFPPEGIKVGMLPDIFYPEEKSKEEFGPRGVTIISRSGAILYHLSDALASAGIAQNAVLGIGGDGAIATRFIDIVPLIQQYQNTDLIVVAGEIGGSQEELLANDITANPKKYPIPIVALISGANAPAGKTMGHAGAIITPGQNYGTFETKKETLEKAGVTVVNSQYELVDTVKEILQGWKYFSVERYQEKMTKTWEEPPKKVGWATLITNVQPNNLIIAGYPLKGIIKKKTFIETAYLLVKGNFPKQEQIKELEHIALKATKHPFPEVAVIEEEDISKTIAKYLLQDITLANYCIQEIKNPPNQLMFCLGRVAGYLASILGNKSILENIDINQPFSHVIYQVLTGQSVIDRKKAGVLEAMIVASVDHGVTPPSAQATIIAATVRAAYEVAVAQGVSAITDVHGGAGTKAAQFFQKCTALAKEKNIELSEAVHENVSIYMKEGKRIQGLGHRYHTRDPRRDVLWIKAKHAGIANECVEISKIITDIFKRVRGINLPINVDGVIGAIIADMGLDPTLAKAVFIYGRIAGLSAHYFEEIASQPQMRRINFSEAVYKGEKTRKIIT
ncbi:MAG: citrate/2-methylcitrate synthase [Candidatus Hodarchaeales archaeon]|jgi:succinyl-CoA synthetase alpha subunit